MWTTSRPFYDRSEHTVNYHDSDGHAYRGNQYQDYGPYRPEWKPSSGNLGQSSDGNYEFQDHSDKQWAENHRTGQNAQRIYPFVHPEGSSSYQHGNQDYRHDHRHYPPGYHYHHHHHHYHNYGSMSNPSKNPSWNLDSSTDTISDRRYDQGYQEHTSNAGDSHSHHDHHYDFGRYGHHHSEHDASNETDQRQFQSSFSPGEYNEDSIRNEHNETKLLDFAQDNLPIGQRTNPNLFPNRQDYSRTNSKFDHLTSFNHTFPPAGNILLNSGNKFAKDWDQNESQDKLSPSWTEQENKSTSWNQPNGSSSFKPSKWHDQQVQPEIQTRPWDQGKIKINIKFVYNFNKILIYFIYIYI